MQSVFSKSGDGFSSENTTNKNLGFRFVQDKVGRGPKREKDLIDARFQF